MKFFFRYYTDSLSLPCINGASEGCVAIAMVYIFTGIVGNIHTILKKVNIHLLILTRHTNL